MKTIFKVLSFVNLVVGKYPTAFLLVVGVLPYLHRCNDKKSDRDYRINQAIRINHVEQQMTKAQNLEDSIVWEQKRLFNQFLQSKRLIDSAMTSIADNGEILKQNEKRIQSIKAKKYEVNFKDSSNSVILQYLPE